MGTPLLGGGEAGANAYDVIKYEGELNFGSSDIGTQKGSPVVITRSSAGVYVFTLPTTYQRLKGGTCFTMVDASGAVLFPLVASEALSTAGTVTVNIRTEAGTATDPDSGSALLWCIKVTNNTANNT